jgi:hypothetical protein
MTSTMNRTLALATAAGVLAVVLPATGQELIAGGENWTLPAPLADVTRSGDNVVSAGGVQIQDGLVRMTAAGLSREDRDGAGTADNLRIHYNYSTRIIELSERADIVVPFLTDGQINFFGANNRSQAQVTTNVKLYREATAGLEDWELVDSAQYDSGLFDRNAGAAATIDISRTDVARFANQPSGGRRYGIDVRMDLRSNANGGVPGTPGAGNANSRVEFDFDTTANNYGAVFSVSAEPVALTANSRVAVDAVQAQQRYGVNGFLAAGVAVLETGRVRTGHTDLPNVNVLAGAGGEEYRTEHALAVAGIIGSRNADSGKAGVAPRVDIISASAIDHGGVLAGAAAIRGQFGAGRAGIINFSATGGATPEQLDTFLTANNNITWVASVGNDAQGLDPNRTYLGHVPNPSYARNNIAVGALESDFSTAAAYSSTSDGLYPAKPDVVAPGSFVQTTAYRDINNNGRVDDYTRSFTGANFARTANAVNPMSANTGAITGTSFAAPHVSGAVALLHDYSARNAGFDARSMDRRVMKALIVGGAKTDGIFDRNGIGWTQEGTRTGEFQQFSSPVNVTRSLDRDFGGGMLSASGSLSMYAGGEARLSDNNTRQNAAIDLRQGSTVPNGRNSFWDLETVSAAAGANPGTVDYYLGGSLLFDVVVQGFQLPVDYLRVALTWDRTVTAGTYDALSNLELFVYADKYGEDFVTGFDGRAGRGNDDYLIASTTGVDENVKLLDFSLRSFQLLAAEMPLNFRPNLYIQVRNLSGVAVEYGLAASFVTVPAPGALGLLGLLGLAATRRRR